jgi:hypothetical protein
LPQSCLSLLRYSQEFELISQPNTGRLYLSFANNYSLVLPKNAEDKNRIVPISGVGFSEPLADRHIGPDAHNPTCLQAGKITSLFFHQCIATQNYFAWNILFGNGKEATLVTQMSCIPAIGITTLTVYFRIERRPFIFLSRPETVFPGKPLNPPVHLRMGRARSSKWPLLRPKPFRIVR